MPRSDLLRLSAPRVELDQRSREARLRLEHVERLLVVRPLPRLSFLKRVLRRLGLRIYVGKQVEGRSGKAVQTDGRPRQGRRMPGETAGGASSFCAAPWISWPNSPRGGRPKSVRLNPAPPTRSSTVQGKFAVRSRRERLTGLAPIGSWTIAGEQSEMRKADRSFTSRDCSCGRVNLNSHVFPDNRF
jgi:hypothetical protein